MNQSTINETSLTRHACSFNLDFQIPITILLGTTFVLSVSENIVVSLVICLDKKLRRPSNGYLLSLALTDICISMGLIPMELTYVWSYPKWPLGSEGTNVLNSVWLFSIVSSFLTLLVITLDRYKAVMSLVRYREVVSWGRTLVFIGVVWLYTSIVVILMRVLAFYPTSGMTYEWNVNYRFYYPFLGLHIVLPLVIISTLYRQIYKKAVENRAQLLLRGQLHGPGSTATSDTVRETRIEVKMAKTVGFVFLFLVIVWIPVLILEIFYAFGSESCVIEQLGVVSLWITCSNGMINPLVYSLRNKDFHRAILQLIRCKRPRPASA
ncbi:5-hydroxytryptamine receptor 1A-beta-like [Actinia tenebrosa]|uniref:5-hydroxytryptamine receptor 1A-beta-like n=1 Tax=Actinia tenebrosa TaxID=6105 RepID=A0A6P8J4H3_ACTTE|nr:5-hydroxytryptamine receptor 1A-beta-like [Actinia tenebrosa]